MRLEATISETEGEQLEDLVDELKMNKSQVVSEALALFKTAVMEIKRGRKVAIVDAASEKPVTTITSPILSQLEWTRERLQLSVSEVRQMAELQNRPPAPPERLRRAMSAQKKK